MCPKREKEGNLKRREPLKILLAFPFQDQETGVAIKEAITSLGHEVFCVDAKTEPFLLFNTCQRYNGDFDLLLCSRTPFLYEEIVKIKKAYNIKTAVWNPDARKSIEDWGPMLYMFEYVDYYFDASEGQIGDFKERGINAHFLPQGLHERRFYPVVPLEEQKHKWSCDVGFIGNITQFHGGRMELLQHIVKSGINLRHFDKVYGLDHNYAVACSKISLCHSVYPEIKNSYSVRTWKVIGSEGIPLDLYHEGIDLLFRGYVESYKTPEECVDKICHILKNYGKYKEKAKKAREWALKGHTYKERIKKLLRITNA